MNKQIDIQQYIKTQPYYKEQQLIDEEEIHEHFLKIDANSWGEAVKDFFVNRVKNSEQFILYSFHNETNIIGTPQPDKFRIVNVDVVRLNNNSCGFPYNKTIVETNTISLTVLEDITTTLIIATNRDKKIEDILNDEKETSN